jgi:hypothetical protein
MGGGPFLFAVYLAGNFLDPSMERRESFCNDADLVDPVLAASCYGYGCDFVLWAGTSFVPIKVALSPNGRFGSRADPADCSSHFSHGDAVAPAQLNAAG